MYRFHVKIGRRNKCPDVASELLDQSAKDVIVPGVATTGDINDDPEEGCVGFVAFIWVLLPEDGHIWVETLQEPTATLEQHIDKTGASYWLK